MTRLDRGPSLGFKPAPTLRSSAGSLFLPPIFNTFFQPTFKGMSLRAAPPDDDRGRGRITVVAAVSMVEVVAVAVALVAATMAMVVVAAIVGAPVVAPTVDGPVAEVTAIVGVVSLLRLLPSSRPALLLSRLVALSSRLVPSQVSPRYQVVGQVLSQLST
jgi:hypothetical protein